MVVFFRTFGGGGGGDVYGRVWSMRDWVVGDFEKWSVEPRD